jgi:hypothetical protein
MEFVCPDKSATVRAANVKATLSAFDLVPEVGTKLIARHQLTLESLTPDNQIPVQRWLDALKEIQSTMGDSTLREVGRKIVENAIFPLELGSVPAVLEALDRIYYMNHRGSVGHYVTRKESSGVITVDCMTPYPKAFEWGLIEGITRNRTLAAGKRFDVSYKDGKPGSGVSCSLTVTPRS